jgi:ubiquinone/menaquinone biosynthesis C-methylase UbiE
MNERKNRIRNHFDELSSDIGRLRRRYRHYHKEQTNYLRYLVPEGKRVLELGCGKGDSLYALKPSYGVGVDLSPEMVKTAQSKYPHLRFLTGDADHPDQMPQETFDYVILSDLVGYLDDIQSCLEGLHHFCEPHTRIIISFYNFLWEPALNAAEFLKLKTPTPQHSWLTPNDMRNLLTLTDYQVVKTEQRLLFPVYIPLLTWLLNHVGTLPVINKACLCHYVVARALPRQQRSDFSVSIVMPCRNEKGNIEPAIQRMPHFGKHQEIIFVDGHSSDGTQDEIRRVMAAHNDKDIKLLVQKHTGKGEAVREGFKESKGDILMILDTDLTVPPEDLPKFYRALASGKAEFLNGCRLVYPMEGEAMRLLNLIANKLFAMTFTWLLGERLKDTLCGTKVLFRKDYETLAQNRSYFGDFDPFGDFDLLFGASKMNLKIIEIPVRYRRRLYGETQISRFRHGLLLMRMVVYAYRKLKSI